MSESTAADIVRRYLQARIVLLRPLLTQLVKQQQQPAENGQLSDPLSLSSRTATQCAITCVAAAGQAISIVSDYGFLDSCGATLNNSTIVNTWWTNILYLYSAATALIAANMCESVLAVIGKSEIASSWNIAMDLFDRFRTHGTWVEQLSDNLRSMERNTIALQTNIRRSDAHQTLIANEHVSYNDNDRSGEQFEGPVMQETSVSQVQDPFLSDIPRSPLHFPLGDADFDELLQLIDNPFSGYSGDAFSL